jgi:hypothetical protein
MACEDKFGELAEKLTQRFVGWTPEPEMVIEAMLRAMPRIFRDAPEEAIQLFVNRLLVALDARIALQNSRWQG